MVATLVLCIVGEASVSIFFVYLSGFFVCVCIYVMFYTKYYFYPKFFIWYVVIYTFIFTHLLVRKRSYNDPFFGLKKREGRVHERPS